MKQLVVLSGKGGTGKTSVAAAFAHLAHVDGRGHRAVIADADVDAANLGLLLSPRVRERELFKGGSVAFIDPQSCTACGECAQACRFDAILPPSVSPPSGRSSGLYQVDPIACDGCAACVYRCPTNAITMQEQVAGEWYRSETSFGPLFHATLKPGQENSGKLVTLVKQRARLLAMDEGYDLVLVDGPPGIGCPVISAVSGASLALIVAEPTRSGVHDMSRVLKTVDHFGVRAMVCVNKADIYPEGAEAIVAFCRERNLVMAGRLPFDAVVTEAMVRGEPVTTYRPDARIAAALRMLWQHVVAALWEQAS